MIFVMLMSSHAMANAVSSPIKNSLAITQKYMPKAFAAMWQSEHFGERNYLNPPVIKIINR